MTTIEGIRWDKGADGVVVLTMDDPTQRVNTMNDVWVSSYARAVERLEQERDTITGVVLTSAKLTFFAGGDLRLLQQGSPEDAPVRTAHVDAIKALMRRLETLGRPVVAAINGTALGGGLEVALATHHRIAVDAPDLRLGTPEVTFGLIPAGGGITRTVRMLGLQTALTEVILSGARLSAAKAHELGLVDELVSSPSELLPRARAWIAANPDATQPWDRKGFKIPGGGPTSPPIAATLPAMAALLRRQLKGAPMPAPRAALAAAVEGAYVDVDTATLIETRYLVSLTSGQVSKNMIHTFFAKQRVDAGASRPEGHPPSEVRRLGVIGAGMMGAGIAYVAAKAGIDVVLADVSLDAATRGKGYAEKLEAKALARGRTEIAKSGALLARITPTGDVADLAGADLVVEAVFESVPVKQEVFSRVEPVVLPDAVLGSNTSTLPISTLAEGVTRPEDFIGIHFFSPVDKMPLVEIVRGAKTSDATLARTFDFVRQIRKTPIVVNDQRGFFTSRVIGTFINEAVAAVGEGVEPSTIEQAALQAGYPAGPLQLLDELTLTLTHKIRQETRAAVEAEGGTWQPHGADAVLDRMIGELDRRGRSTGGGFYAYDEDGRRTSIWPGLREAFASGSVEVPFVDLQERMLFAEAIDAVRCLGDGVLTSVEDADVGSLLGIGFPPWTGGVLHYIAQYEGGTAGFVARARALAAAYGPRFEPPASLVAAAEAGTVLV
ncbi:3-hydroxyacyl-CoA dehydrogenase NAD-binding domain-containing protein [Mumia sp. ZJ430]|uniref:3-hydroxyacyl-CoA dehydrogenase NAD-binding domain-containing protein n=1 Tax=Mumia sp. ZJ430 TaxID=2708083 RepID=UPI00141E11EF|nr:3-hydroxyacyl-CoA dehydrogenase NAD-binding domain-containing protein [Mumia sp. ZJ430]